MGLDAAVYADDDNEIAIASLRIGNLDGVVRLRESIRARLPEATVLLTKVLYSAFHGGEVLENEDVARAKIELDQLSAHCSDDDHLQEFVAGFGGLLLTAMKNDRPVTFT